MDDNELERLATNNPAMTVPASSTLSQLDHKAGRRRAGNDGALAEYSPSSTVQKSDPAGDIAITTTSRSSIPRSKYDKGWRRVVRNFSPSWFSVTMGTGIVSLLFITIPWKADWLYWLSVIFFVLNIILFSLASILSILRYTLYPEIWTVMIHDPNNSLFISTATMGFATIIEAFIFLCCPYWGAWATTFACVLWMIDAVAAFAVTTSLGFLLISETYLQSLDRITAAQLLPIASLIVAAATGAEAAHALINYTPNPQPAFALGTLLTSYIMWGMSTPFAMVTLVIYYQRLAVHKLPPREIIVSSFLPLGPLGMGGYTIMYLGAQARSIIPLNAPFLAHIPGAADMLYILGLFIALIMWSFGTIWFVYAIAAIYNCGSFPFNMGWWGFTFPLGVFAVSTIQLGIEFPSLVFRVLGTIFAVMVIVLWVVVFAGTVLGAWRGHLFYAPCLKDLPREARHGGCVKTVTVEERERIKMANEPRNDGEDGDLEKGV